MAQPTIYFVKNLLGGTTELDYIEVNEAVKRGDIIVSIGDKSHAERMDDNAEFTLGVATHDAAANTICAFVPASPWNLFAFLLETTIYDDSVDRHTHCDVSNFTSGAMAIDTNVDTTHMIWLMGNRDGNDISITAAAGDVAIGGEVLGIFAETRYIPPQVIA